MQHKRQIEDYTKRERQFEALIAKYKQRSQADSEYIDSMEGKTQQVRHVSISSSAALLFWLVHNFNLVVLVLCLSILVVYGSLIVVKLYTQCVHV